MVKRIQTYKHKLSRIKRIERKCDRMLSELLVLRQIISRQYDVDKMIEGLHETARNLRIQSERERERIRNMFNSETE